MNENDLGDLVLAVLQKGPLDIYNLPMVGQWRIGMTQLCTAIRNLNKRGIKCGRTDAGGRPTWALELKKEVDI